jgi:hypothetical protein
MVCSKCYFKLRIISESLSLEDAAIENPNPKQYECFVRNGSFNVYFTFLYKLVFQDQRGKEKEGLKS